jgi:hypothetical protein
LVDRALIGSYSIVHRVSANSFSGEAVGLGVHPSGAWTELPEMGLEVSEVQTSSPEALATSLFFLLAVEEAAGQYPGEIGPSIGALIDVAPFFSDRFGVDTSLPKIRFSGLRMTSLRRGVAGVIPDFVSIAEPGVLRLDFRSPEALMGFDRWVYAFHLHRAGRFPKAVRGVETVTHCPFSAGCQ